MARAVEFGPEGHGNGQLRPRRQTHQRDGRRGHRQRVDQREYREEEADRQDIGRHQPGGSPAVQRPTPDEHRGDGGCSIGREGGDKAQVGPPLHIRQMDLLEEEGGDEAGRADQRGQHAPEQGMAQHVGARPVAMIHSGHVVFGGNGLRGALKAQQPPDHRQAKGDGQACDKPELLPVQDGFQRDKAEGHHHLAHGKAKCGDGQRPPARGNEPARHGNASRLNHHALPEKAQGEDCHGQKPAGGAGRHEQAGKGKRRKDGDAQMAHAKAVGQCAGPEHDKGRCHGAGRIKRAPFAMAKPVLGADFGGEDRNQIGLSKARKEGQQEACE